jgi:hypothetical protein
MIGKPLLEESLKGDKKALMIEEEAEKVGENVQRQTERSVTKYIEEETKKGNEECSNFENYSEKDKVDKMNETKMNENKIETRMNGSNRYKSNRDESNRYKSNRDESNTQESNRDESNRYKSNRDESNTQESNRHENYTDENYEYADSDAENVNENSKIEGKRKRGLEKGLLRRNSVRQKRKGKCRFPSSHQYQHHANELDDQGE